MARRLEAFRRAFPCLLILAEALGCTEGDDRAKIAQFCQDASGDRDARAEASDHGFPAAVAIFRFNDEVGYLCSGTLVARSAVLTAGHCIADHGEWSYEVYVDADLKAAGAPWSVVSSSVHPTLDLALLKLAEEAPGTLSLPRWSGDAASGDDHEAAAMVLGYGGPDGDLSKCLRMSHGVQELVPEPFGDELTVGVLVDGVVSFGDSGGPLLIEVDGARPILVGVFSEFIPGETTRGTLATYVRLPADDPWLRDSFPEPPVALP